MTIVRQGVLRLLSVAPLLCASVSPSLAQQEPGSQPLAASSPGSGQNGQGDSSGRRTMTALRLQEGEKLALDGVLDEPFWSRTIPAANFIQQDPQNGRPATEPTEVRIAFDGDALYMGVTAYDSEPDRWIGWQRRRDEGLGSDDRFMWVIDTFLDGRSGYFFEMNPSGLMADSLIGINGENRQWDGIWNARARHSEIGWTLEIKIPFRTLNFNPNTDTWGVNFQRTVRRKNEESLWMGWGRSQGIRRMSNTGLVTGIRDVTQGRGLDIKPYGVFSSQASPGRGQSAMQGDASTGVDLFYNPTPLLRTVFTVNTDFAQTEVDQRQVNLTRYSLFFPERRDFFLDGATFLDFGSNSERRGNGGFWFGEGNNNNNSDELIMPFFSRRVGLSANATPQKIDFGTKVTGQVGAQDVGLIHVRTGEDNGFTSEDFTVARVKRRILSQSYIGAMYTRRDPLAGGTDARHTTGVDMSLATSGFRGDKNVELGAWYLRTTRPDRTDGNSAFGVSFDYPNDRWVAGMNATEVQENFDPAIGFVRRLNYRRYNPMLAFQPRPRNNAIVRQYRFGTTVDLMTDLSNQLLMREIDMSIFGVSTHSQDNVFLSVINRRERLDSPFAISRSITLPIGSEYDFTRLRVIAQTANRRMVAANGRFETGDFYSGTRQERQLTLSLRLRPGYFLRLEGQWNRIELPEGRLTTRLYRIIGETQFSPFIALTNNIQYDSQSGVLGWQGRFRWILTPGNDLYLVYTHNWVEEPLLDRFYTSDKRLASKILYTYRF
ncbi:MAG: carbohydrate binding family 9 domain-containing protein [Acidobacteria bacterium]|nr:carbohydrate binding family 9 domain-containing protein [Acidobacteriota bacterium]